MNDHQHLRDSLREVVPEPPSPRTWGADARGRSRQRRRRRLGAGIAVVVVAALAVPVVRSLTTGHPLPVVSGSVHGTGVTACRQLDHRDRLGAALDTRVVDGATTAAWLRTIHTGPDPTSYHGSAPVTVCVLGHLRQDSYTVVAVRSGEPVAVVAHGDHHMPVAVIAALDRLWKGGARLTSAPFRCTTSTPATDVTSTLPPGPTGALLCLDGGIHHSPPVVLTQGLDSLVNAVNGGTITYEPPYSTCAGTPFAQGYRLVLRYPGGTRTVDGDSCGWYGVGHVARPEGSTTIGQRALALLEEHDAAAPGSLAPPPCPSTGQRTPSGSGDLLHIVAARWCPAGGSTGRVLSAAQVGVLRRWAADPGLGGYNGGRCTTPTGTDAHLTLTDAWGEQFTTTVVCPRAHLLTRLTFGSDTSVTRDEALVLDRPARALLHGLARSS